MRIFETHPRQESAEELLPDWRDGIVDYSTFVGRIRKSMPNYLATRICTLQEYTNLNPVQQVGLVSGGYDPFHPGHIALNDAVIRDGKLLVMLVMGDEFLLNKKGAFLFSIEQRLKILAHFQDLYAVIPYFRRGDDSVIQALNIIKPDAFYNAGDRKGSDKIPEADVCKRLKIAMCFPTELCNDAVASMGSSPLLQAYMRSVISHMTIKEIYSLFVDGDLGADTKKPPERLL